MVAKACANISFVAHEDYRHYTRSTNTSLDQDNNSVTSSPKFAAHVKLVAQLGQLAYRVLRQTVHTNKKSVPRVMSVEGMEMMIKHKLLAEVGSTQPGAGAEAGEVGAKTSSALTRPSWTPPIRAVMISNQQESRNQ